MLYQVLRGLTKLNKVAEGCSSQLRPGFHGTAQDYTRNMRGIAELILKAVRKNQ